MYVEFTFRWGTAYKQEQFTAIQDILGVDQPIESTFDEEKGDYKIDSWSTRYVANLDDVFKVVPTETIEVRKVLPQPKLYDIGQSVTTLQSALLDFERRLTDLKHTEQTFNEKCQVHVPGLGLLAINEVIWKEDCCTELLQNILDDGWRILACCPQPDQRRPDYILGRTRY